MTITFSALAAEISAAHDIDLAEVTDVLFDELVGWGITDDEADRVRAVVQKSRDYIDSLTGGVHHAAQANRGEGEHHGFYLPACTCGWKSGGYWSNEGRAFKHAQNHVAAARKLAATS